LIICSGDSYTDAKFESTLVPDYDCSFPKWPELLKFDEPVTNVGQCGADNNFIVKSAYKEAKKHNNVSKIILGLSDWTRFLIFFRKFNPQLWTNPKLKDIPGLEPEILKQKRLLGSIGDEVLAPMALNWFLDQTLDNIHMLWDYCKSKNIELVIFQMLWPVAVNKNYNRQFYNTLLNDQRFLDLKEVSIGWPLHSVVEGICMAELFDPDVHHIKARIDAHPNAEGHQFIAKWFMGEYNKR